MSQDEELFAEALALAAPERPAFLDRACAGDPARRAHIEELLAGYDEADRLLAVPLAARPVPLPDERPGDRVGRYQLREKIGEGGCGAVWLAEQQEPVRRRVALKVIKLGMDTREVITRFEAERQALALMEHPHIARVLDAGATDTGRPFFVMELVRGLPITRHCDEQALPTRARLELFVHVCHAIQHAHQKGVIHRDIKPSNILVALHDGVAAPKVIDFGIAKATQGRLTEATAFTAFEQFIGTPAYMSPEQTEPHALDVDTRTDIYSLGVLLYELLAGQPPFAPQALASAGFDEARRLIRETEPPRPSARFATLSGGERAAVARLRGAAPARLASLLRGDLDWIVMKALEKDRARRYETAGALAADVQHYLSGRPVVARPPSAAYRLRKTIARHRVGFAASGLVVAALIAGLTFSLIALAREKAAEKLTAAARARAEDVLEFMLREHSRQLDEAGQSPLMRAVVQQAIDYYEHLPVELRDANTAAGHGFALALRAAVHVAYGETALAHADYERALAVFQEAERRGPLAPRARLAQAEALVFYGGLLRNDGRPAEAGAWCDRAIVLLESLLGDARYGHEAQWRLADTLRAKAVGLDATRATRPQAPPVFERALAVALAVEQAAPSDPRPGDQPSLITFYYARALLNLGEDARGRELLAQAHARISEVRSRQPQQRAVISVFCEIARLRQRLAWRDWDDATAASVLAEYSTALKEFVRADPDRWSSRRDLASLGGDEMAFRAANGEWPRVRQLVQEARPHYKAAEDNNAMRSFHIAFLQRAAQHCAATDADAEANDLLAVARQETAARLAEIPRDSAERAVAEATFQNSFREIEIARLNPTAVREDAAATLANLSRVAPAGAMTAEVAAARRAAGLHTSWAAFVLGDYDAAAISLREARGWDPPIRELADARSRQARADAAHAALGWAQALARAGRLDEARAMLAVAQREVEALHACRPDLFVTQRLVARACWTRLDVEPNLRGAEKRALLARAAQIYRVGSEEGRLDRFERDFIVPDIARQLAALPEKQSK